MPFFLGTRAMLGCTKKANMATEQTCPITLSLARETKPSAAAMWLGDFLRSSEGRGYAMRQLQALASQGVLGPGLLLVIGLTPLPPRNTPSPPLPCSGPGSETYSCLPCTSRPQRPPHVNSRTRKCARIQRPMSHKNGFLAECSHSLNDTQPWSRRGCTRVQARLRAHTGPCSFFLRAFQLAHGCHPCALGELLHFPKALMELSPFIRRKSLSRPRHTTIVNMKATSQTGG